MKNRHLYIAIGTKHRELDAKVLLACHAAKAGYKVYVGSVSAIQKQLHYLPKGIYIKQLVTEGTTGALKRFRSYGHTVCAFDEEGLVFPDPEAYKRERISANAMKHVSKFFAWGEYQAKLVREVIGPENANMVVVTGHPRLDILRPEWRDFYKPQAEAYQKEHGRYILINTNFDLFNHADGREAFFERLRNAGRINSPEAEKWFRGWAAFRGRMYRCFRELVQELATQLPDKTFIIRPHPSENHDEWRKFTSDLQNVKVIYEGAAIPWILGSDALIHNGCTTAVEAYVLGKPVISYQPFKDDRYENYLPNAVGQIAYKPDDVYVWLTEGVCGLDDSLTRPTEKTMAFANFFPIEPESNTFELIDKELDTITGERFKLKDYISWFLFKINAILKVVLRKKASKPLTKTTPLAIDAKQRKQVIELTEVQSIIAKFKSIDKNLLSITCNPNSNNLYVIKTKN